jgi:hypothetical protein
MILWQCELCGKTAYKRHEAVNMRCMCSTAQPKKQPCTHRTPRIGRGSCGCGSFFRCQKYGVVCSDRRPHDELYTITLNLDAGGSEQLSEAGYRCCGGCSEFTTL